MGRFKNRLVKRVMAVILSGVMVMSGVPSSGMTVMASGNPDNTGTKYAYTKTGTTDIIEEDIGAADEEEALEQDGAAGIDNREDPEGEEGSKDSTSESKIEEQSSENEGAEKKSSEEQSSEDESTERKSSEEQSSEDESSEEQSSDEQSSEEQSSDNGSEPIGFTSGSGKIDVWDFGGVQQSNTAIYENHITIADWDANNGLGTDGKFTTTSTKFGDLTITHNSGDRLYSASTKKKAGTLDLYCTYEYSDGYKANGCYYANGTGGNNRRYLTIDNVSIGDRIDVYVGSSDKKDTTFYFEYTGTDGTQKDTGYATHVEGADAKIYNTKLMFVAKHAGTYKIWADAAGGKPIYNRLARTHAANVKGTIDLGPLAAGTNFMVKFVNETTKDETFATLDGTSFSAKLAPGYTYNAVLSGATGYGFSNASKKVTVTDEEAVNGKAYIKLVVEEKTVYDYTGTIKGFAQDYDVSKLKVIMVTGPDEESDDVELTIDENLGFTAKLEPDVAYTITLEGVNDYKVKEGEEIVNKSAAYQADINVVLKETYAVTGKFVDLEGSEVTGVTALTFRNDDDKYEYEATLAADKKSYTVKLRDGAYSAVPTIENYSTTEHVVVDGKAVEKDILFVSTVADGTLELKPDLYVGYTDKGDANYETVNKAVKAAKRMNPSEEAERITIHIAPGVYREQVIVDVPYVSFVNDTPEREVKITWYQGIGYQYYSSVSGLYSAQDAHDKYKKGEPKNWGAAVQIKSTGFLAEHIVFEHSLNRYITDEELEDGVEPTAAGGKPVRNYSLDVKSKNATERGCALYIDSGGNNAEFYQCTFLSSQDTLGTGKTGAHAYFKECFIEGNTDYICYDGDTVFDNCVLNFYGYSDTGSGGYITAAQDSAANGYLFRNCTITGSKSMIVAAGYLGRPWGQGAKVTFVNTKLEKAGLITDVGWTSMSNATPENANFKEYNTTLLDGTKVDTSKRTAGTVLTENPVKDVSVYFGEWTPKHYVEEEETVAFEVKPFVTDNGDLNTPYPGHTLTVGYSLGEANDANDASVIQWYRVSDKADATKDVLVKASAAGVDKTYKITREDIGSYIKVVVTPITVSGNAGEAESCIVEEAVRDGYEDPDASGGDAELGDGVNIFLVGDSTVKDYSAKGMTTGGNARDEGSWGEFLQSYLNEEKVTVVNYANGGRSSRSFINEGSWAKVVENLSDGDYVFIQFGHNDSANGKDYLADRYVPLGTPDASGVFPTTPGTKVTTPAELKDKNYGDTCYTYNCGGTYKWYLKLYIDEARAKGAIPVLVTPVSRMYYNADGTIKPHHDSTDTTTGTYVSSNNAYVTAVKQLAQEQDVLLIDGFELTKKLFEDAYKAGKNDTYGKQIMHNGDSTHNNKLGGMIEAAVIATAIQGKEWNISYAVKAPTQVIGQTTTGKTVFNVDGNGKFTAYDILKEYSEKAPYWEELGQKMFDAIGEKSAELKPANVEKPTASPVNGSIVTSGQKITLTAEKGAQIRYTTDKSEPKKDSTLYDAEKGIVISDAMIINNAVTIKAIAIIDDRSSAVATFTYTITAGGSTGNDDVVDDTKVKADEDEEVINLGDTTKITVTAANVYAVNNKVSYKVSVTYTPKNGKPQELKENVHYNVRFVNGSDGMTVGPQKIIVEQVEDKDPNKKGEPVVTDLGTFKGQSAPVEYELVDKKSTPKTDIAKVVKGLSSEAKNMIYTGEYKTPEIEWKTDDEKGPKDEKGKDQYMVVYRNNVNAGKASVTVLGVGEYYGSKTLTFTIKPAKLTDIQPTITATGINKFDYVGKNVTPTPDTFDYKGSPVTFNGLKIEKTYENNYTAKLKKSIDYTIDYKKNAQEGTATATIKGVNNYSGSIKVTYKIQIKPFEQEDLDKATVVAERALQGSGVSEIIINGVTLKAGVDFKPDNNPLKEITETSQITESISVPIKGMGAYKKAFDKSATVSVTTIGAGKFHIKAGTVVDPAKLEKAKITDVNGKAIKATGSAISEIERFAISDGVYSNEYISVIAAQDSGFENTNVPCHVATKLSSVAKQDKAAIIKEFDGVNTVTLTKNEIVEHIEGKKGDIAVKANEITIVSYKNNHKTGNATVTIQATDASPYYGTMNIKFKIEADRKAPEYYTGAEGSDTPGSSEGSDTPGSGGDTEETEPTPDPCEKKHTIWVVGDSTVSSFNDTTYYYPRYGYGTQVGNYFDSKCEVKNIALSGRSSKSYLKDKEYTTLKNGIKEGDVLIIGFGHNDEKTAADRYTNPNGDYKTEGSFAKSLYDNYVKIAQDKGAQAILCTPIVRRSSSNTLSSKNCHITPDETGEDGKTYQGGDYPQAIRDLGEDVDVPVVDLTALTKALYESIGADETLYMHAWTGNDPSKVDNTHLNIYGAKRVAYIFAKELKEKHAGTIDIARHVINLGTEPSKDKDLKANGDDKETEYDSNLKQSTLWADYGVFKGTVFGDVSGDDKITKANFTLEEAADKSMHIVAGVAGNQGKIASTSDGIAMYYYKVPVGKTFSFSATAKINSLSSSAKGQNGFGLMARDDMYIDYGTAVASDYVVAGTLGPSDTSHGVNCFYRQSGTLTKGEELTVETLEAGKTYDLSIVYNGDGYACKFGKEETQSGGFDFQLTSVDGDYVYIGMFAARNADISFSNIQLTVDGQAVDLKLPQ